MSLAANSNAAVASRAPASIAMAIAAPGPGDHWLHILCAVMTEEFLRLSAAAGNDLSTPVPEFDYPGLQSGDRCAAMAGFNFVQLAKISQWRRDKLIAGWKALPLLDGPISSLAAQTLRVCRRATVEGSQYALSTASN